MPFVTYENYVNKHVTIHLIGCGHVKKHGGTHKYGQGGYQEHSTFAMVDAYAQATGFPVKHCSFCIPQGRPAVTE